MRRRSTAIGRWGWALALLVPAVARAGNDDEVLVGNDAALSSGAVIATIGDGSSLYYNPAGLTHIQDDTIDVSGSAYTLRVYDGDGLLLTSDGTVGGDSFTEVVIVPSAVAYVRPLSASVRLGFGVFTLRQSDLTLRAQLSTTLDDGRQERLLLTVRDQTQLMLGILGVGWSIDPRLRLGVSLSVGYLRTETSLQFGAGVADGDDSPPTEFFALSQLDAVSGLATRVTAGMQWRLAPRWQVGASVETPGILFYSSSQSDGLVSAIGDDPVFEPTGAEDSRFSWEPYTPLRARLGAAYVEDDRLWVSVDVDLQSPLTNASVGVDRQTTFNARIGGQMRFAPTWWVGAGLFTDRNGDRVDRGRTDFYGGTFGVRYRRDRRLDTDVEADDDLTFETVIAVRYAYGFGETDAVAVDFGAEEVVQEVFTRLEVHEISLHVGASLRF